MMMMLDIGNTLDIGNWVCKSVAVRAHDINLEAIE